MKKWQLKALTQQAISLLPHSESFNYILQRYVRRKIQRNDKALKNLIANARLHLDALSRFSPRALDCICYEFGAGWDLGGPMAFWCLGVDHQVCIDIVPHVRFDLINRVIQQLRTSDVDGLRRIPAHPVQCYEDLFRSYGIRYKAPCDARNTGLPNESIDLISSTYTFEHIPPRDILPILRESLRILSKGGVMSHIIDYQDHYNYFDSTITCYNFLRYGERAWRIYNPSISFQSRLRHKDYLDLLRQAGFKCLMNCPRCSQDDMDELNRVPIHAEFLEKYSLEELAVRSSHIVSSRQ